MGRLIHTYIHTCKHMHLYVTCVCSSNGLNYENAIKSTYTENSDKSRLPYESSAHRSGGENLQLRMMSIQFLLWGNRPSRALLIRKQMGVAGICQWLTPSLPLFQESHWWELTVETHLQVGRREVVPKILPSSVPCSYRH